MFIYGLFLVSRVHRAKAGGSYSARRRTPTLLLVMCLVSAIRPDKAEINKSKAWSVVVESNQPQDQDLTSD